MAVVVGTLVGIVSGYFGGWVDELLMRLVDVLIAIPFLPILIVFVAVVGKSIWNLVVLVAIFSWMSIARLVRSQTLTLRERTFVEAARAAGAAPRLHHDEPTFCPTSWARSSPRWCCSSPAPSSPRRR